MPKPKRNPRPDTVDLMIHAIPRDVKNRFKIACAIGGDSMRTALVRMMENYAKRWLDQC